MVNMHCCNRHFLVVQRHHLRYGVHDDGLASRGRGNVHRLATDRVTQAGEDNNHGADHRSNYASKGGT